jgi:hypothetical protein
MSELGDAIPLLLTAKGSFYWALTMLCAAATAVIHFVNDRNRAAIDTALARGKRGPPIGLFEACGASGCIAPERPLTVPERLWCYDDRYLRTFVKRASSQATAFGDDALSRYVRPTLLWNDFAFAIALAMTIVLLSLGLAPLLPWQPASGHIGLALACLGLGYGAADMAEDCRLARLLRARGVAIAPSAAAAANWMTRLKLVLISLSIIGLALFWVLVLVSRFALPRLPSAS